MDEILINDKKYISSKQAAKLTGYAKDYVGQLCREGRVPARLVGRSWYVLESAIQDHRFGAPAAEDRSNTSPKKASPTSDWKQESPRYEAIPIDLLPPINQSKKPQIEANDEAKDPNEGVKSLQSSWKGWFDRVGETISSVSEDEFAPEQVGPAAEAEEVVPEAYFQQEIAKTIEDEEVSIPIHNIYRTPPREILPRAVDNASIEQEQPAHRIRKGNTKLGRVLVTLAVIVAVATVSMAVVGSGYFDYFVSSYNQIQYISGTIVYNK
jgi:hypothetical protein